MRTTQLEPCDCGSAQENHGWACRCDNPPSKRKVAIALEAREAMRAHRRNKPISFDNPRRPNE